MSPLDAVRKEISAELDALERRMAKGHMPEAIIVRVELDKSTGMPRAVSVEESRRRRILGGALN